MTCRNPKIYTLTNDNGSSIGSNTNSLIAGDNGPILLQNTNLIEKLQHFNRERIPERVVHARGIGTHGFFVSTYDMSEYTKMNVLSGNNKKTEVFVRFSSVTHGKDSPETLRDPRGFATKFYTEEGNWDLVCNNFPVFFIRDPMQFTDMVHSLKPNPVTNIQEPSRFFDFFSFIPECISMFTFLFSDLGTPASYRHIDGHSVNAYKFINSKNEITYVKFKWSTRQGIKNFTNEESQKVRGEDFNFLTNDLYNSIKDGKLPSWDLQVQLLKMEDFKNYDYDLLDATKQWLCVPYITIGYMTLDRIPDNFFDFTEQVAFSVSNFVNGIEPSEDRILQARLFSMKDSQMHRIGVNNRNLKVNQPINAIINYNQDGKLNYSNPKGTINYSPSNHCDKYIDNPELKHVPLKLYGFTNEVSIPLKKQKNFYQAGILFKSFTTKDQNNLISNFGGALKHVKDNNNIIITIIAFAYKADIGYGTKLAKEVGIDLEKIIEKSKQL